jgi:hypothetical protein
VDLDVSFKGRQHDHAGVCELRANGNHGVDTTDVGQSQVHERDVRPMLPVTPDSLMAGCSLGNQQHIRFVPDHRRNALPHQRVIVDTENSI